MMRFMILALALFGTRPSHALVNGIISPLTDPIPFPTTVALRKVGDTNSFCTASKVAARTFLTAAHCVYDSSTRAVSTAFMRGNTIEYTNLANPVPVLISLPIPGPYFPAVIDEVHVNPAFHSACAAPGCSLGGLVHLAADVAVIVVRDEPLLGIFPAFLDFTNVAPENGVVIGGYGCENAAFGTLEPRYPAGYSRLSYASTAAKGVGIFASSGIGGALPDTHLFWTPGKQIDPSFASVCQGDSGGPVYRNDGTRHNIVGVNSAIHSFDSSGLGVVNNHARISGIESWLRSVLR